MAEYEDDISQAREEGYAEGRAQGHKDVLNWLEQQYMGENRPDRGSTEAVAILSLTGDLVKHLKEIAK